MSKLSLTLDDFDTWALVTGICVRYQADTTHPDFFNRLLAQYPGSEPDNAALAAWVEKQIQSLFVAVDKRPWWIQSPSWAFTDDDTPMVFIGQLDIKIPHGESEVYQYHDDTSLYLFISKDGSETAVVKQQY